MMTKFDIQQRRQSMYQQRARNARFYARMLMPLALVAFSAGLWSDPVLGPQLQTGVEEIKPKLAGYLTDTPLEDILGPVPVEQAALAEDAATEEAALALPAE